MKIITLYLLIVASYAAVEVNAQSYSPMQNQVNRAAQQEQMQIMRDIRNMQQMEQADRFSDRMEAARGNNPSPRRGFSLDNDNFESRFDRGY